MRVVRDFIIPSRNGSQSVRHKLLSVPYNGTCNLSLLISLASSSAPITGAQVGVTQSCLQFPIDTLQRCLVVLLHLPRKLFPSSHLSRLSLKSPSAQKLPLPCRGAGPFLPLESLFVFSSPTTRQRSSLELGLCPPHLSCSPLGAAWHRDTPGHG